jgi:hypothetical protein
VHAIYRLSDPTSGETRYVGKTDFPAKRLRQHLFDAAHGKKTHLSAWVRQLLLNDFAPEMHVVETLDDDDDWEQAERDWISLFRESGCDLTNHTVGGRGTPGVRNRRTYIHWTHSKSALDKIKAASQGRSPWNTGKPLSDAHRANIGAANRGRPVSQETRDKIRASRLATEALRASR